MLSAFLLACVAHTAARDHAWPVTPPALVGCFAPPSQPWLAGHRGVDLAAGPDAPVLAAAAGTVTFAGDVGGIPSVTVTHRGGLRTTYQPVVAEVAVGDAVAAGQVIGHRGDGGHCGGDAACVHIGLLRGDAYLDPAAWIARMPAVLKPLRDRRGR